MKVKSICLVCRGAKIKLGAPCLGCNGHGWVFVKYEPTPKPEPVDYDEAVTTVKKVKVKPLAVEEPLPPPDVNRRVLGIRAKTRGLTEKIISAVRDYQHDYIYSMDILRLRPMVLKDIASIVGCDVVTVHQHLRNRQINGIDVREMFSEAVSGVSRKVVMQMIKCFVEKDSTPHSDSQIQEYLKTKEINVSRRTVTKYRNQINIPSGYKRKKA